MQRITDNEIRALKEEGQRLKPDLQQQMNTSGRLLEFHVNKYTRTEDIVYSPAFFTHPHSYRMCVRVIPHGQLDGKGTHVSLYMHIN